MLSKKVFVFLVAFGLVAVSQASATVVTYGYGREAAFNAATTGVTTVNYEGIDPTGTYDGDVGGNGEATPPNLYWHNLVGVWNSYTSIALLNDLWGINDAVLAPSGSGTTSIANPIGGVRGPRSVPCWRRPASYPRGTPHTTAVCDWREVVSKPQPVNRDRNSTSTQTTMFQAHVIQARASAPREHPSGQLRRESTTRCDVIPLTAPPRWMSRAGGAPARRARSAPPAGLPPAPWTTEAPGLCCGGRGPEGRCRGSSGSRHPLHVHRRCCCRDREGVHADDPEDLRTDPVANLHGDRAGRHARRARISGRDRERHGRSDCPCSVDLHRAGARASTETAPAPARAACSASSATALSGAQGAAAVHGQSEEHEDRHQQQDDEGTDRSFGTTFHAIPGHVSRPTGEAIEARDAPKRVSDLPELPERRAVRPLRSFAGVAQRSEA